MDPTSGDTEKKCQACDITHQLFLLRTNTSLLKTPHKNHISTKQVRAGGGGGLPGRVCSVGHQSADQQLVAVLSSNVEGSIAILIHTINLPT